MKNSICHFCSVLFFLLILGSNASAQENTSSMNFSLFGGLSLPQGDFASTDMKNDKAGFAKTGFCAMAEGSKNLNENVLWVSSLSLALNSMDESALKAPSSYYDNYSVSAGNYFTSYALTGIGYETVISPNINIYGVGQIGLLLSSMPEIKTSYIYYSGSYDYSYSNSITSKMGASFAYGFGVGIKVKIFNIGLRYYSSEPEYEQTHKASVTTNVSGYSSNYEDSETKKVKKPTTVLQLLVGITL